jgi:hypothetical protein
MFFAWQVHVPLDSPADPTDTTTSPRPDWYFLFLFQLLRYFEGDYEIIGTFVLPTILTMLLFAIPFLDRNPKKKLRHRPVAITSLVIVTGLWGWLTYASVRETPQPKMVQRPPGMIPPRAERIKRPSEVGGLYVLESFCLECHSMTPHGERPDLATLSKNQFPSGAVWLQQHLQEQGKDVSLQDKEVEELVSVLRLVAGGETDLLARIPPAARYGAHFFYNSSCPVCHTIDGQGGKEPEVPSPDLTLRLPRTKEWHIKHIYDPQSLVPESKMPPFFHYEPHEYDALAEYLLYLHAP